MSKSYFQKLWLSIKQTGRSINLSLLKSFFQDSLFYLTSFLVLQIWSYLATRQSALVQMPANFNPTDASAVNVAVGTMTQFLIFLAISIVAFFAIAVCLYSFFKPLAWFSYMKGGHFQWHFYWKFSLLNLMWFTSWFVFIVAVALSLKPTVAVFVEIFLLFFLLHFSMILIYQFIKWKEIKKAFGESFRIGISLHHFLLPYLMLSLGYLIILQPLRLLSFLSTVQDFDIIYGIAYVIVSLLYFALARLYMFNLFRELT